MMFFLTVKSRELCKLMTCCCIMMLFPRECLQAQTLPLNVVISRQDVAMLGGWPIERRWYGMAIQKLRQAGAGRIFLDIAFPSADILHPESDEFFFKQLEQTLEVFLLADDVQNGAGKNTILGTRQIPTDKFTYPFSKGFSINHGNLEFKKGGKTIVDFFLSTDFTNDEVLIEFPATEQSADFTLAEVLYNSLNCGGRDVILHLDYPGVTSYIVGPRSNVVSTSSLQLWTIRQIQSGNYETFLSPWKLILCVLVVIAPVGFGSVKKKKSFLFGIASTALWLIATVIMWSWEIHFSAWWLLAVIPAIGFLLAWFVLRMKEKRILHRAAQQNSVSTAENGVQEEKLRELEYRLEYYERLSNQIPISELEQGYESHGIWCHKDSPLVEILMKAERVAKNEISVIIRGESGTGKEMLAQFIHRNSHRHDKPIIAVNCGALNDNLIEAELFGYEKGAFTGAYQQKQGRFELASGGTLFLDEVSETSLAFQVKLLRVLQEGVIERVGGTKTIPVSVRIIAATHQDLARAVNKKLFREDLFYRLNGYEFFLPPLRERPMDIEYLFKRFLYEIDKNVKYSEPMIEWLKAQSWPGNIRQLKGATQRAVINAQLRKRSFLIPKDFELAEIKNDRSGSAEQLAEQVLQKLRDQQFHHRSISAVATELMIHRSTVTEYLRGWTIKFLNAGDGNRDFVLSSLRGTAPVSDEEQLRNRVDEYISYVETRIAEGLRNVQTDEEILGTKFRNLPVVFRNDLLKLIQKKRSLTESGKSATNF